MKYVKSALLCLLLAVPAVASPFATSVLDYTPGAGQFINSSMFNDPTEALGAPTGGGTYSPNNTSLVSLGGFGGSLTLAFDHRVMDDALNPMGLDTIVFGNAFWVSGNPQRHWAECGVIEIALDANGDGQANDPWYLISGSHITDPLAQYESVTWNRTDSSLPPTDKADYPNESNYPGWPDEYTTGTYRLPADPFETQILENPNAPDATEGIYGYADFAPTLVLGDLDGDNIPDETMLPEDFYTVPDDPFTVGMSEGSGGGDAFDIAWAVDPVTGALANLPGFDFLRISTGVLFDAGKFGEISTEIDAVADVAPIGAPVPAPPSVLLALSGLAILALRRRRA